MKETTRDTKGMLLLDAGDLLFKKSSNPVAAHDMPMLKERARVVLKSIEVMGYDAIGIGDDELALGKSFLTELSKTVPVRFLSSNVMDEGSGNPLFQRYLVKDVNGIKVAVFSLLSPNVFTSQSDSRKKGIVLREPFQTAQEMVQELGPQADILILLSHLGYPADVELAQKLPGLHLILGGHTGVHLANPPIFNGTILLQSASKGMYAGRLDLTLLNRERLFYNTATKSSLKANLDQFRRRLASPKATESEKAQWRRGIESAEKALQQLEGKNYFTHTFFPLSASIQDHPEIGKIVEAYHAKFPHTEPPPLHDSRGIYSPKR